MCLEARQVLGQSRAHDERAGCRQDDRFTESTGCAHAGASDASDSSLSDDQPSDITLSDVRRLDARRVRRRARRSLRAIGVAVRTRWGGDQHDEIFDRTSSKDSRRDQVPADPGSRWVRCRELANDRERPARDGEPEMTLARRIGGWAAAAALGVWAPGALAADASDPHAHHRHHVAPEAARTSAAYAVPDVALGRDDGQTVLLSQELEDGRPVVLSFIFTSCTTVCPMISAALAQLQRKLGPARDQVHLMSISIDPEFDTPVRLREYASKLGAGPEWQHYSGTLAASQAAQRAFGV